MIILAHLTYKRQDVVSPDWKDLQFGRLGWGGPDKDYFRVYLDIVPLVHHTEWFIGNALVDDPPEIFGDIQVSAGKQGQTRYNIWHKLGHIGTRESPDGKRRQYYGQLLAIPVAAIVYQARKDSSMNCLMLDIKKERHDDTTTNET